MGLLLLSRAVQAQYIYTTNNGAITITGYTGDGALLITNTITDLPVTGIGGSAFRGSSVTNVTIPSSVTNIGLFAFLRCATLTAIVVETNNPAYSSAEGVLFDKNQTALICCPGGKVGSYTIPDSVTSIWTEAFDNCISLTNVTLGASVASVPLATGLAFYNCTALSAITVHPSNSTYSSVEGVLFNKNATTLVLYPLGKPGSYTIPNGVTNIGYFAFYVCNNLTGITIPTSVTQIDSGAFDHCRSLTNVTIPSSVTTIADSAFRNCSSLTNVTIPSSVTNIGDSAFSYCSSLPSVTIPQGVLRLGSYVFSSCYSLTNVTIPASVTSLGYLAFNDDSHLTAITVDPANPNYSSLDGVLFNKNQTTLMQCPGGKTGDYTIPPGVTSLADSAFFKCRELTRITIPSGVISLGTYEFYNCISLTNVTIPSSVTFIGTYAFADDYNLASITIPASVTRIEYGAFYNCYSLTNVTIPASVSSLGASAFYSCTNLTSVTVGSSVTNLGSSAFANCNNLLGVYFQWNAPSSGAGLFSGATNTTVYYLPGATGFAATYAGQPTVLLSGAPTVILNVTASPANSGTVTGGGTYAVGTNVQITATANTHWRFTGWNDSNTNTLRTVNVPVEGATYTASFTSIFSGAAPALLTPPVITNALLVISNQFVIVVGETNVFNVSAADPVNNSLLRYRWNFGDGATSDWSAAAVATHIYPTNNCGPYTASVTVSNTQAAISSNLNVSAACQLTITKLQIGLSFIKTNADSGTLIAKLNLPGVTNLTQLTGRTVLVDIGDVQVPFTLDNKGRGGSVPRTCRLAYTKPTKTKAGYWTATIALSKGLWRSPWAAYGLNNATHKSAAKYFVPVPVAVLVNNEAFAAEKLLNYTSVTNKTGTAK